MIHRSRPLFSNLLMLLVVASLPDTAAARSRSADEERQIGHCIARAAKGQAWLERTLWGLRDQEAGWLGAAVANTNGTHDLGPLQVNSWWVPRVSKLVGRPSESVRHWLRYDACFNAEVARWIFLSGLAAAGDYWTAIGIYHSPTSWRQRRYAASVATHLTRRFGGDVFQSKSR